MTLPTGPVFMCRATSSMLSGIESALDAVDTLAPV
jgi:hypothetical protein